MKKLIEDNYQSIVERGLINSTTSKTEFLDKIYEELSEFEESCIDNITIDFEELADIILVCLNMAKHYKIDIEQVLKDKVKKNFERAKNQK